MQQNNQHMTTIRKHISGLSLDFSTLCVLNGERADRYGMVSTDGDILAKLRHINDGIKAIGEVFKEIDSQEQNNTLPEEIRHQIEQEAEAKYPLKTPRNKKGEEMVQRVGQNPHGYAKHRKIVVAHIEAATVWATKYQEVVEGNDRLQEENRQLLEWKRQMLEVWNPVLDWGQKNVELGKSIPNEILKTLQEHQQLKERVRMLLLFIENDGKPVDGYRFREEAIKLREALTAYQANKNEG